MHWQDQTSPMRILVVEADAGVASFVSQGLREASFAVDVVNDGTEGYRRAISGVYDLVILDLMLPGKDGYAVLQDLRGRQIQTPVIFLTAKDAVSDRVRGLNLGA